MTWKQRTVYILQTLQEYSPMLLFIAMLLLPGALLHQQLYHDEVRVNSAEPPLLKLLFLLTFATSKVNAFVLHGHTGVARVSKLQAHDIWSAPCKLCPLFPASMEQFIVTFLVVGSKSQIINFGIRCRCPLLEIASPDVSSVHLQTKRIYHVQSKRTI
jgi:hypothetical protein